MGFRGEFWISFEVGLGVVGRVNGSSGRGTLGIYGYILGLCLRFECSRELSRPRRGCQSARWFYMLLLTCTQQSTSELRPLYEQAIKSEPVPNSRSSYSHPSDRIVYISEPPPPSKTFKTSTSATTHSTMQRLQNPCTLKHVYTLTTPSYSHTQTIN